MGQRPNELTPHRSLQHYWGAELRALRIAHGFSLAELGRLLHCDPSYLAKIERAERPIPATLVESCDRVLETQGMLVRLYDLTRSAPDEAAATGGHVSAQLASENGHVANSTGNLAVGTGLSAVPDTGEEIVVPARTSDGRVVFVSVPRRVFLHGIGSAAVGLSAAPVASATPLPAVGDFHPIEHFRQLRLVLAENDMLFGPRQVIPLVREQIAVLQRLRSSRRGTDQRELIRMQALYTQFHGGLRMDTGNHDLAESSVDRALGLAQMAEDRDLTVYFLTCKAQLAGDMRVAADAIGAAEQALRMSAPNSPTATAAAIFAGHGYALSGDHAAMERAYDRAHELHASTDAAPDCPCRTWWLDEDRIALHRAWSLTALGEHQRAAQSFLDTIDHLPGRYRRSRGVWLARTSRALADDNEPEHAAVLGREALTIGADTKSWRTLSELRHLDSTLAPYHTVPAVADFRTAMKDAVPAPA